MYDCEDFSCYDESCARISKQQVLTSVSKTAAPLKTEHIKSHMQKLFPKDAPAAELPHLVDVMKKRPIIMPAWGTIYVAFVGGKKHSVIYMKSGFMVLEGNSSCSDWPSKSKNGRAIFTGLEAWYKHIGAELEDVLVAGRPKTD